MGLFWKPKREFLSSKSIKITNAFLGDVAKRLKTGIADSNLVEIDSASVTNGEYAKFTANGLESKSANEVVADLSSVPKAVNRQNNTTNSTVSNQLIQSGWGYIPGAATNYLTETITFPVEFDSAPIVVVTFIGQRATADGTPDNSSWFNTAPADFAMTEDIAKSGFKVWLWQRDSGSNFATSQNYGYTWIAIGTKAR